MGLKNICVHGILCYVMLKKKTANNISSSRKQTYIFAVYCVPSLVHKLDRIPCLMVLKISNLVDEEPQFNCMMIVFDYIFCFLFFLRFFILGHVAIAIFMCEFMSVKALSDSDNRDTEIE